MPPKIQSDLEKPIHSPQSHLGSSSIGSSFFTIASFPGHEILSINEKRLCTNLRLTPAHYIRFKNDIKYNMIEKEVQFEAIREMVISCKMF
jgi:hypothetical protein